MPYYTEPQYNSISSDGILFNKSGKLLNFYIYVERCRCFLYLWFFYNCISVFYKNMYCMVHYSCGRSCSYFLMILSRSSFELCMDSTINLCCVFLFTAFSQSVPIRPTYIHIKPTFSYTILPSSLFIFSLCGNVHTYLHTNFSVIIVSNVLFLVSF